MITHELAREHQRDLLRQAEAAHLARVASATHTRTPGPTLANRTSPLPAIRRLMRLAGAS